MRIGTAEVEVGDTYTCPACDQFALTVQGLPSLLICVDHFGAHVSGNRTVMARTLAVSEA